MEHKNCVYGLIGYPLSHSFSQRYFTEKFEKEGLVNHSYVNFPLASIAELCKMIESNPRLCGFNVTIPYKEQIIPYIDEMDHISGEVGAVNTVYVARKDNKVYLKSYNTDVYGFSRSLEDWLLASRKPAPQKALILGTGGASKAVAVALQRLSITSGYISRKPGKDIYKTYDQLDADDIASHRLIINTTPLGMYPRPDEYPDIPYQFLTADHFLYDLIYNPEETMFMSKGREMGASVHNGERMLHLQADMAWEIWHGEDNIELPLKRESPYKEE